MKTDFTRIAIVNRGEAAMRFINAARELSHENGCALCTIAFYTEPDRQAMFVREADESCDLGSALFVDPRDGTRKSRYFDLERLERALVDTGAEAVWAGWGFVAEDAAFVEMLERLGIVFIGPPAATMRLLGDKIAAKRLAESIGVPVVPWSGGPVASTQDALAAGERLGYPLMIKASAGGGGRGIRSVVAPEALAEALARARAEAAKAFGDSTLLLEKHLEGVRHVEVQILGDHHGALWACGVRDCTIQRKHQKILEESPAPTLSADEDRTVREVALRIGRAVGYRNAGTVEFLFDPRTREFLFMEVNTRLQVEHTVTEVTTGLDLVKLQLHVARGDASPASRLRPSAMPSRYGSTPRIPTTAFSPLPGPSPSSVSRRDPAFGSTAASRWATACPRSSTRWWRSSSPTAAIGRRLWRGSAAPSRTARSCSKAARPTGPSSWTSSPVRR